MKFMFHIFGFVIASGTSILYLLANDPEPKGAVVSLILWMTLGVITASLSYLAFSAKNRPKGRAECISFGFASGLAFHIGLNLITFDVDLSLSVLAGIIGIISVTAILFRKSKENLTGS